MRLRRTIGSDERRALDEGTARPRKADPPPDRSAARLTCRDVLAEARSRLAAKGFDWFEALPNRPGRGSRAVPPEPVGALPV